MNFEEHDAMARKFTSLEKAREACTNSYNKAIELIGSKSTEEMFEPMTDELIIGGGPEFVIVSGIVEHTAHHRGSLSVYTRLCGKFPPMPYMDSDAMASN